MAVKHYCTFLASLGGYMKVAILSDVHANIYALKAVLSAIEKDNIDKVIVAGDFVGYYYWPSEVVEICMEEDRFICIKGNHEANLKEILDDRKKLIPLTKKYGSSYKICLEALSATQIDWLVNLPESRTEQFDKVSFYFTHGSLKSLNEYVYPDADVGHLQENFSDAKYTVLGHTHYPLIYSWQGRCLLNPGSVGQPRDIGGLASFFIVNTENHVVSPKRVPFSVESIVRHVEMYDEETPYLKNVLMR